jgi:pilus assembly protein CpaE
MSDNDAGKSGGDRLRVLIALDVREVDDTQVLMAGLQKGNELRLDIAGISREAAMVYDDAVELGADVVLLSPQLIGYTPDLIQRLYHHEEHPILTVGVVDPTGDWAETMTKAGAVGHLNKPLTPEKLGKLAGMLPGAVKKAYQHRSSESYIPRVSAEVAQVIDRGGWRRQTIAIWSPAGGVGKTSLAANVAAVLGVIANKRVLLIDGDMNKGDVHLLFDLVPGDSNIYALAKEFEARGRLTGTEVKSRTLPYRNSNLRILQGIPKTWMAGDKCFGGPDGEQGTEFVKQLLTVVEPMFDFVVCDLGQTYNHPVHLTLLQQADMVFLVVNSTVTSVYAAHQALEDLRKIGLLESDRLRVVLNKFHPSHGLDRKGIQDDLEGLPVFGTIPIDETQDVVMALNDGEPLVLFNRKSAVAQEIVQLAIGLYPPLADIEKARGGKKGGLRGLLGG